MVAFCRGVYRQLHCIAFLTCLMPIFIPFTAANGISEKVLRATGLTDRPEILQMRRWPQCAKSANRHFRISPPPQKNGALSNFSFALRPMGRFLAKTLVRCTRHRSAKQSHNFRNIGSGGSGHHINFKKSHSTGTTPVVRPRRLGMRQCRQRSAVLHVDQPT